MAKRALIVHGGWDGHHPAATADLFRKWLTADGFDVEVADTLDAFADRPLGSFDLIVPHWTMGRITAEQVNPALKAVQDGVGIAGCHGGMCDAFRENTEWQFMTGGQFVAHPGNDGTEYQLRVTPVKHEITDGMFGQFRVKSEQYYMHVDPAVRVLATTSFPVADGPHATNGIVEMPVVWTKYYGRGKVFYNSLGHDPAVLSSEPCQTIMRRGFAWAARN